MNRLTMLQGMKVVDFSTFVAGPTCAKILGEYGADVIRVEPHIGDSVRYVARQMQGVTNGDNPFYDNINGNKRQICLETRTAQGLEVLHRLLADADVFVCNMRENQAKKSGLDWESLHEKYPKLVYANVTGYGDHGPLAGRAGFDNTAYHSRTGLNSATLQPGETPTTAYTGLGDIPTGTYLAMGVMAAYVQAQRTGVGEFVTASLYGAGMWSEVFPVVFAQAPYEDRYPKERADRLLLTQNFRTADGRWFTLNTGNWEKDWPRLAKGLGFDETLIAQTARLNDAMPVHRQLYQMVTEAFAKEDYAHWNALLNELDIAHDLCQTFREVVDDPAALEADLLQPVRYAHSGSEVKLVRSPVQFRLGGLPETEPARDVGADTMEILRACGYGDREIAAMEEQGIIGVPGDPDVYNRYWSSKFDGKKK